MSLSVGIVGLPNAGKSTLFNALAARRLAETAAHPFTTIEPHEAVVPVPDENVQKLADLVKPEKATPATVTFIDIAGLIKGASQGEGLGNQFLGKIREVDAIVHVVRAFEDPNVAHVHPSAKLGTSGQVKEDIEVVNLELELGGITGKPTIYVLNVNESKISNTVSHVRTSIEQVIPGGSPMVVVAAKLEEELADFQAEERREYLKELGVKESGLEKLIKHAYKLLGLITFYTIKGGKEVRAWSIKNGATAIEAAGEVHTDFAQSFIKAEVIEVDRLLAVGSWKEAKDNGLVRLEGRDYAVRDRDVIEFKTSA